MVMVVLATAQKICSYTLFRLFISLSALAIKNTVVAKKEKKKKKYESKLETLCSSFFGVFFKKMSLFLLSERLFFSLSLLIWVRDVGTPRLLNRKGSSSHSVVYL